MTETEWAILLYTALGAKVGLLLLGSDAEKARQRLYQVRSRARDRRLDCLQIRLSPVEGGNLVICRGGPKQEAAE